MPPDTTMVDVPVTVTPVSVPGRTQVLEGGNVGAQNTIPLELARPFDHVPIRPNKRRFKPTNPANKRSRRKITQ